MPSCPRCEKEMEHQEETTPNKVPGQGIYFCGCCDYVIPVAEYKNWRNE